jgi:hypothetical protein
VDGAFATALHAFGVSKATRHDKVIAIQVNQLDRKRIKQKVAAKVSGLGGQILHPGGPNRCFLQVSRKSLPHDERSAEVGPRQQAMQSFSHPFSAAALGKVVMKYSHPRKFLCHPNSLLTLSKGESVGCESSESDLVCSGSGSRMAMVTSA